MLLFSAIFKILLFPHKKSVRPRRKAGFTLKGYTLLNAYVIVTAAAKAMCMPELWPVPYKQKTSSKTGFTLVCYSFIDNYISCFQKSQTEILLS